MNITEYTNQQQVSHSLPQLIKMSTTYKLKVPSKVEEKIRYLCRKFPTLEWSGILFTTHEGSFDEGNLVITCQDLYPMDLGSGTFTSFKMDESVAGYIAENIELFGCDMALCHSHNQMAAFFSGTDLSTLQSEGNDQNCFISLIVNNEGTYCAAITRKVQTKKRITTEYLGSSYSFFGEGERQLTGSDVGIEDIDTTVIEYFKLDIEVERISNPLAYLDTRFDEIEAKKKTATKEIPSWATNTPSTIHNPASRIWDNDDIDEIDDYTFNQWKKEKIGQVEQPTLWPKKEMDELIDTSNWCPNQQIIHHLVCQMVTCSLIVNKDIDLKQWVTRHLQKKYKEIFGEEETLFNEWKEFIVEFIINSYNDPDTPAEVYDDYDMYQNKVATALYDELYQYTDNSYINDYCEVLTRYIYE